MDPLRALGVPGQTPLFHAPAAVSGRSTVTLDIATRPCFVLLTPWMPWLWSQAGEQCSSACPGWPPAWPAGTGTVEHRDCWAQGWSGTEIVGHRDGRTQGRSGTGMVAVPASENSAVFSPRTQEQPGPRAKEPRTIWPSPGPGNSPDLEVYHVIRKQSEADLAETRPDLKNISFRGCSGEATPDNMSCDSNHAAVNPSESGFVTLASIESGFVTNDIYEFSPDHRLARSSECGWVDNEIYGY